MNAILCTKKPRGRKPCDEGLRGAGRDANHHAPSSGPSGSMATMLRAWACHLPSDEHVSDLSPELPSSRLGLEPRLTKPPWQGPSVPGSGGSTTRPSSQDGKAALVPHTPPPTSTNGLESCCSHLGEPSTRTKNTLPFIPLLKHKTIYTN